MGGVLEKDRNEYILICDKERRPNIFEITYQLRMLYTAISFLSLGRNLENSPHMEIANAKFLTSEVFVFKIYQYCSKILRSVTHGWFVLQSFATSIKTEALLSERFCSISVSVN